MGLFDKKEPKPLGASFPFMERIGNEKTLLRYDAMRISHNSDTITLTFLQEGVPVYAWTYDAAYGDYTIEGLRGHVELRMTR